MLSLEFSKKIHINIMVAKTRNYKLNYKIVYVYKTHK
jgi:hypothetical protein